MIGVILAVALSAADGAQQPPVVDAEAPESIYPTPNLYPAAALQAGEQGVTRVRVTYAVGGAVSCAVVHSTATITLDRAACPLLTRRLPLAPAEQRPAGTLRTFEVHWRKMDRAEQPNDDDDTALAISAERWITDGDYPPDAMRKDQSGAVKIKVDVSPQGAPTRCTVVVTSKVAELDDAACRLIMRNGHFLPALDRDGKARPGVDVRNIRWVLPAPVEVETVMVSFATPGDDSRCVVVRTDRRQALPIILCQKMAEYLRSQGKTDLRQVTIPLPKTSLPPPIFEDVAAGGAGR